MYGYFIGIGRLQKSKIVIGEGGWGGAGGSLETRRALFSPHIYLFFNFFDYISIFSIIIC